MEVSGVSAAVGAPHVGPPLSHAEPGLDSKLRLAIGVMAATLVLELVGSFLSGSLALLGDAGHVLLDLLAILLTYGTIRLARAPPSARATWGHHRAEVLAALLNSATVAVLGAVLLLSAVVRMTSPREVDAPLLLLFASAGLALNAVVALGLSSSKDVNVRSAFLHVAGDLASSALVVAGAVAIQLTGSRILDPLLGVGVSLLLFAGAYRVAKEAVQMLMERPPPGFDAAAAADRFARVPGVRGVHDLHAWRLCSTVVALSAHVVVDPAGSRSRVVPGLLVAASAIGSVVHPTFQIEAEACAVAGSRCGAAYNRKGEAITSPNTSGNP